MLLTWYISQTYLVPYDNGHSMILDDTSYVHELNSQRINSEMHEVYIILICNDYKCSVYITLLVYIRSTRVLESNATGAQSLNQELFLSFQYLTECEWKQTMTSVWKQKRPFHSWLKITFARNSTLVRSERNSYTEAWVQKVGPGIFDLRKSFCFRKFLAIKSSVLDRGQSVDLHGNYLASQRGNRDKSVGLGFK